MFYNVSSRFLSVLFNPLSVRVGYKVNLKKHFFLFNFVKYSVEGRCGFYKLLFRENDSTWISLMGARSSRRFWKFTRFTTCCDLSIFFVKCNLNCARFVRFFTLFSKDFHYSWAFWIYKRSIISTTVKKLQPFEKKSSNILAQVKLHFTKNSLWQNDVNLINF